MPGQRPHSSQPWDDLDLFAAQPRHDRRKPLIRVVCPVCAAIVTVNALDVEGTTDSLCSKCENTTISIGTDDSGHITSIEGWANPAEKKAKPPDRKTVGLYVLLGILVLLLLMILLRPAVSSPPLAQTPAGQVASPLNNDAGLASPADRLNDVVEREPGKSAPSASPATQDMFAPEKH